MVNHIVRISYLSVHEKSDTKETSRLAIPPDPNKNKQELPLLTCVVQ